MVARLLALLAALGLLSGCKSIPTALSSFGADPSAQDEAAHSALASQVSVQGAFGHLQALQRIADQNDGTRVAGGRGYDASVAYVAQVLRNAGYLVATPTYRAPSVDGDSDSSDSDSDHHDSDDSGRGTRAGGGSGPVLRQVVAQTRTGDFTHVVTAGAHLDSVKAGPGINDDGSGVASLLEIATRMGGSPNVRNAVRFGFWGSEEIGGDASGSASYLRSLAEAERSKIMVYLNLDMAASPNAGYFVQGGKGSDAGEAGPPGSATAAQVLTGQLTRTGVTVENTPLTGDDDAAFVEAGIPTAGALTGNDQEKSAAQAKAWGGQSGVVFDRCYHSACDRIDNINRDALARYTRAFAGTIAYFSTRPAA